MLFFLTLVIGYHLNKHGVGVLVNKVRYIWKALRIVRCKYWSKFEREIEGVRERERERE